MPPKYSPEFQSLVADWCRLASRERDSLLRKAADMSDRINRVRRCAGLMATDDGTGAHFDLDDNSVHELFETLARLCGDIYEFEYQAVMNRRGGKGGKENGPYGRGEGGKGKDGTAPSIYTYNTSRINANMDTGTYRGRGKGSANMNMGTGTGSDVVDVTPVDVIFGMPLDANYRYGDHDSHGRHRYTVWMPDRAQDRSRSRDDR